MLNRRQFVASSADRVSSARLEALDTASTTSSTAMYGHFKPLNSTWVRTTAIAIDSGSVTRRPQSL